MAPLEPTDFETVHIEQAVWGTLNVPAHRLIDGTAPLPLPTLDDIASPEAEAAFQAQTVAAAGGEGPFGAEWYVRISYLVNSSRPLSRSIPRNEMAVATRRDDDDDGDGDSDSNDNGNDNGNDLVIDFGQSTPAATPAAIASQIRWLENLYNALKAGGPSFRFSTLDFRKLFTCPIIFIPVDKPTPAPATPASLPRMLTIPAPTIEPDLSTPLDRAVTLDRVFTTEMARVLCANMPGPMKHVGADCGCDPDSPFPSSPPGRERFVPECDPSAIFPDRMDLSIRNFITVRLLLLRMLQPCVVKQS